MSLSFVFYVLPPLFAAILLSYLAAHVWRYRATAASMPFVVTLICVALWAGCACLEDFFGGLEAKLLCRKLGYLGRASICPSVLVVALYVTNRAHWVKPSLVALLATVPVAAFLLGLGGDTQHLVWATAQVDVTGSVSVLVLTFGPLFWLNTALSYVEILAGGSLLAAKYFGDWENYRREAILVLGALAMPTAANAVYLSGIGLLPDVDFTPHALVIAGLLLSQGVLRYGALDVVQVAPIAIVEEMGDGVVVVDMRDRLVYVNSAAREILDLHYVVGVESIHTALAAHPDLIELFRGAIEGRSEIVLGRGEARADYDLQISPLMAPHGAITSRVLVLRDITDRKQTEEELQRESARVQLMLEVAVAANEASSIEGALETCLRLICTQMNWSLGHVYRTAEDHGLQLVSTYIWYADDPGCFAELRAAREASRFSSGEGLPGRVLASRKPCWIVDVTRDRDCQQTEYAGDFGVKAAMAFPVKLGAEITCVLEFFAPEPREPDGRMLDVLKHIGAQIGRVTERVRAERQIRDLAFYDGLTGLANRRLFHEELRAALRSARRYSRVVGLLFVDLDGFKHVNDTLGHTVGDRLLCEVAERFTRVVRESDRVGRAVAPEDSAAAISRLGGDEFTILLTEISSPRDAAQVAQRLLDALAYPFNMGGHEVFASCSIGIALYPDDGDAGETLLRNADAAMYCAKNRGHACYEFYSSSMNAGGKRRLQLESFLRRALDGGEFSLVYQPLRDVRTSEVLAAEALLRWTQPEIGPVPPDEFIPIAEETGLILSIGEWVLRTACIQGQQWNLEGYRPIRLAVNFSGHQIRQQGMIDIVSRTLRETGLSPGRLELEITESTIMQDDEFTNRALCKLADMGVGLALDDFGTGYSSLAYLRRFPLERLKIDRAFTKEITSCREDAALTAGIIALAHGLRLKVVGEGVETQEQADFLCQHHCDELQGYLFSPPVPPEEFVRFLKREKGEDEEDEELAEWGQGS